MENRNNISATNKMYPLKPLFLSKPTVKVNRSSRRASITSFVPPASTDPITEEEVEAYITKNPKFLKEYIVQNIDCLTLNKWMTMRSDLYTRSYLPYQRFIDRQPTILSTEILKELIKQPHNVEDFIHIPTSNIKTLESTSVAETETLLISQKFRESMVQSKKADIGCIYMVNLDSKSLALLDPVREEGRKYIKMMYRFGDSNCVAALSAVRKKIIVQTFLDDFDSYRKHRPKGTCAVMAVPLIRGDGTVVSVVELYRYSENEAFLYEDKLYAACYAQWAKMCLTFSEMYNENIEKQHVRSFILRVARNLFSKITSIDELMLEIVSYAKALSKADRAALFFLNEDRTYLHRRITDSTDGKKMIIIHSGQDAFPAKDGILGCVIQSGKSENLVNVQNDPRFNPDVDRRSNNDTHSLLCVPIIVNNNIIGAMQLLNSSHGYFSCDNEEYIRTFAYYCGLAIHVTRMYDASIKSQQQCKATLEVMTLHTQCTEAEVKALKKQPFPESIPNITSFSYSPWTVPHEQKVVDVIFMFQDLFSVSVQENDRLRATTWLRFDITTVLRFVLTVRKNYRAVPYHNWDHALSVNQAAYVILKRFAKGRFALEEELAMFIGSLCHDIDHRGKSNQFMINNKSPLASLYVTSTMEQHHFNLTVTILQRDGHNIFQMLSSERYRSILDLIKHCILSTDLGQFGSRGPELAHKLELDCLDFNNKDDRNLLISNCMTACDLCAMYKPWHIQFSVVLIIMKEFWLEGDEEKRNGRIPIPLMDRDYRHLLPECQVGFITDVCLPCFSNIACVFHEYGQGVKLVQNNLNRWQALKQMDETERLKKLAEMELRIYDLKRNLCSDRKDERPSHRQSMQFANIPVTTDKFDESSTFSTESFD